MLLDARADSAAVQRCLAAFAAAGANEVELMARRAVVDVVDFDLAAFTDAPPLRGRRHRPLRRRRRGHTVFGRDRPRAAVRRRRGVLRPQRMSSGARLAGVRGAPYTEGVKAISVRVENGRITGVAPAGLPDGEIELALVEPEDEMSDEEFQRLEAALHAGIEDVRRGQTLSANDVAAALLRRHA
jgi:hypothetical protein